MPKARVSEIVRALFKQLATEEPKLMSVEQARALTGIFVQEPEVWRRVGSSGTGGARWGGAVAWRVAVKAVTDPL